MEKPNSKITIIGKHYLFDFGDYSFEIFYETEIKMTFLSLKGDTKGFRETVAISITELGSEAYMITWQEASKTTVTHVNDYARQIARSNITIPDMIFMHLTGTVSEIKAGEEQIAS